MPFHLDLNRAVFVSWATMVAFVRPHEEPPLQQAHQVLAKTLLRPSSDRSHSTPSVTGWRASLLVGWMTIIVLWGIGHVIVALR